MTDEPAPRLTICAGLAVRNEAPYLRFLLPALAAQDIDVAVIDNGSTDESLELCEQFTGRPVISVTHLPHHGVASLTERLEAMQRLFAECDHDWVVHHDADEILEHATRGRTLRDAIEDAAAAGFTALNFEEFVFLPEPTMDYRDRDYYREMSRYYFHEPSKQRLNRAWQNSPGVSNLNAAGHRLEGPELCIAPDDHVLRHYIGLSQQHVRDKYLQRRHDPREVQRGWHVNRLDFSHENLTIPSRHPYLLALSDPITGELSRAHPARKHFWEWGPSDADETESRRGAEPDVRPSATVPSSSGDQRDRPSGAAQDTTVVQASTEPSVQPSQVNVLVLGMHRSGTSAVGEVLRRMGLSMGLTDREPRVAFDNPVGFAERHDVMVFNNALLESLGWFWDSPTSAPLVEPPDRSEQVKEGRKLVEQAFADAPVWFMKDPRFSLLLPWWRKILVDRFVAIVPVRPIEEVVWSLHTRNALPLALCVALTSAYYRHLYAGLQGLPVVFVRFSELVADTAGVAAELAQALEGAGVRCQFDIEQATAATDPTLVRVTQPPMDDVAALLSQNPISVEPMTQARVDFRPRFEEKPTAAQPWEAGLLDLQRRLHAAEVEVTKLRRVATRSAAAAPQPRPRSTPPARPAAAAPKPAPKPAAAPPADSSTATKPKSTPPT